MRRAQHPEGSYVEHTTTVHVRFHEIDVLGVVWHGHYLSYFEDARIALGDAFGVGYNEMLKANLIGPIVKASCEFIEPAHFGDRLEVTARLNCERIAKLNMIYEVRRSDDDHLLATGSTTQVFTDLNGEMILSSPDFLTRFHDQCDRGEHRIHD